LEADYSGDHHFVKSRPGGCPVAGALDRVGPRWEKDIWMSAKQSNSAARVTDALKLAAKNISAGKPEEAVNICRKILTQFPDDARIHYGLAIGLTQTGKPEEAIAVYRKAIRLNPAFFEAHLNLGVVLSGMGNLNEAIAEFSLAARLRPNVAEVHVNLSNALRDTWQIDDAIAESEKALALNPSLADAHVCLGAALACRGQFDRAMAAYRDAIRIRPDFAVAHLNLALAELVTGNLQQGWPEYEWRQKCASVLQPRNFSQPAWNGEKLEGKTILLYAEQGFGDAIHFIRYAPLVTKMGGEILLECQPALVRLFRNVPGVERVFATGQVAGQFDLHCALPSLPHVFRTTLQSIPATIPYLAAEPLEVEIWRERINQSGKQLEIGLAWAGSAENRNDRNRSIPLEKFSPLLSQERFRFHSLQIISPPAGAGFSLLDWSAHLKDFADTAALIANLDLIISVDTAVAHLAAAMGKKVWLLVPFPPDWRWLLDRSDSLWYPTIQLFRQETPGDWDDVIRRLFTTQF
jgi:tetratricopeptide (TPR) repeat protein